MPVGSSEGQKRNAYSGGKTTTHALGLLEPRGTLFTGIQQEVYNGMIIGECARDGEMEVILSNQVSHVLLPVARNLCVKLQLPTCASAVVYPKLTSFCHHFARSIECVCLGSVNSSVIAPRLQF